MLVGADQVKAIDALEAVAVSAVGAVGGAMAFTDAGESDHALTPAALMAATR